MISILSQLIIDNMEVRRWLFKVNDESGGNGTAYCDIILHLKCYHWVLKERQKHSAEIWSKKWAHVSNKGAGYLVAWLLPRLLGLFLTASLFSKLLFEDIDKHWCYRVQSSLYKVVGNSNSDFKKIIIKYPKV